MKIDTLLYIRSLYFAKGLNLYKRLWYHMSISIAPQKKLLWFSSYLYIQKTLKEEVFQQCCQTWTTKDRSLFKFHYGTVLLHRYWTTLCTRKGIVGQ